MAPPSRTMPPVPDILRPSTSMSLRGLKQASTPREDRPLGGGQADALQGGVEASGKGALAPWGDDLPAQAGFLEQKGSAAGYPAVHLDAVGGAIIQAQLALRFLVIAHQSGVRAEA